MASHLPVGLLRYAYAKAADDYLRSLPLEHLAGRGGFLPIVREPDDEGQEATDPEIWLLADEAGGDGESTLPL
jgi:hypothetical protein